MFSYNVSCSPQGPGQVADCSSLAVAVVYQKVMEGGGGTQ